MQPILIEADFCQRNDRRIEIGEHVATSLLGLFNYAADAAQFSTTFAYQFRQGR